MFYYLIITLGAGGCRKRLVARATRRGDEISQGEGETHSGIIVRRQLFIRL